MFTEDDFAAGNKQSELLWKCKRCGAEFKQRMFRYGYEPRCFECMPLLTDRATSNAELKMFNFMCSIERSKYECVNGDILNWTTLKNGKQLDILCKRKDSGIIDLAFEFNGIYWHQLKVVGQRYHLNKTIECECLGIKLVHIWEDEWNEHQEETKRLITSILRDECCACTGNGIIELGLC